MDDAILLRLKRALARNRRFPENTCPASRHVQLMGDALAGGRGYAMFEEEPEHCAVSLFSTVNALFKARSEIARLKARLGNRRGGREHPATFEGEGPVLGTARPADACSDHCSPITDHHARSAP